MKRKRESSPPSTSKPRPIPANPSTTSRNVFTDPKNHDTTTWTCILSYLSMEDLESFSQTHPKMQEIVNTYLDRSNALVIDDNTLLKYPVQTHESLYSKYSSRTKNLTISCTEEESGLLLVFPLFPTITQLTMRGLSNMNIECFPLLKNLFLINNKEENFLQHESLESLYLEGNPYLVLLDCPKLFNLTVIDQKLGCSHFKGTQLKRLTMERCWHPFDYSRVKSFTQLQHLRIVHPVNEKEKREIEDLKLTSTDFFCYQVPKEENQILSLNDDCIRYFAEFLTTKDQLALMHSHSRFLLLHNSEYEIDRCTFKQVPLRANWNSYQVICPLMTEVELTKLSEDALEVLSLFTNLKELSITSDEWERTKWIQCIPNGLKKLCIYGKIMQMAPDLSSLFQRLSPTLEDLELETTMVYVTNPDTGTTEVVVARMGLDHLRNLKEFTCCEMGISPELGQLLENNRETMTRLEIKVRHDYKPLWGLIRTMKNLKYLTVRVAERIESEVPELDHDSSTQGGGNLPLLEELVLGFKESTHNNVVHRGMAEFLKDLDKTELRSFQFLTEPKNIEASIFEKMGNLVKLYIICNDSSSEWPVLRDAILALSNLEKLGVIFMRDDGIMPFVKGLPKLRALETTQYWMDVERNEEVYKMVQKYMRRENRPFRLNEHILC